MSKKLSHKGVSEYHGATRLCILDEKKDQSFSARSRMVWLCGGARLTSQAVRMVWAPMVVYIAKDPRYSLPPDQRGHVLAAFSLGYLMTQVIGGYLADRHGGAPLILVATVVNGLSMLLVPALGALFGLPGLSAPYFLMGLFSGVVHPAYNKLLAVWVPPKDIGFASTIGEAGAVLGTLAAFVMCPTISAFFGWEWVCYGAACAMFAFAIVWGAMASSYPIDGASNSATTNDLEVAKGQKPTATTVQPALPPIAILLHLPMWAAVLQHITYNFHRYFFVEWMPTYFDMVFGASPASSSLYGSTAEIVGLAVSMAIGPLERWLLFKRQWPLLSCRRVFGIVGFGGMALIAVQMARLESARALSDSSSAAAAPRSSPLLTSNDYMSGFIVLMLVNPIFYMLHNCGFKANYMELTTQYSGIFMGVGNTLASFATFSMPLLVGRILHSSNGTWTMAFVGLAGINVIALLVARTMMDVNKVDAWLEDRRHK